MRYTVSPCHMISVPTTEYQLCSLNLKVGAISVSDTQLCVMTCLCQGQLTAQRPGSGDRMPVIHVFCFLNSCILSRPSAYERVLPTFRRALPHWITLSGNSAIQKHTYTSLIFWTLLSPVELRTKINLTSLPFVHVIVYNLNRPNSVYKFTFKYSPTLETI